MNQYILNQSVNLRVTIKVSGALADPTGLTFMLQDPDGTETSYIYGTNAQLEKDAVGKYHVQYTLNKYGIWTVRYEGTGAAPGATEYQVEVIPSKFYP